MCKSTKLLDKAFLVVGSCDTYTQLLNAVKYCKLLSLPYTDTEQLKKFINLRLRSVKKDTKMTNDEYSMLRQYLDRRLEIG